MDSQELNDIELFKEMKSRLLIELPDNIKSNICDSDAKSMEVDFKDPIYGNVRLRIYTYNNACVCTSWQASSDFGMPNVAYINNCFTSNLLLEQFIKTVSNYFKDPINHWYGDVDDKWKDIEYQLVEFIKNFGAYFTTDKILKTPKLSDNEKASLLAYLSLDDCIQKAKERDARISIYVQDSVKEKKIRKVKDNG